FFTHFRALATESFIFCVEKLQKNKNNYQTPWSRVGCL
ncbi:MAG: hypothetical protein ACI9Y7_000861, partial [Dokdonia sp.]